MEAKTAQNVQGTVVVMGGGIASIKMNEPLL